ncbi:OmpA family protein [Brevundimonas sp.]|uniref:OmpA family protein n=1 Tax=Brevundimonas sp. TaxID=1871086 RepID=UPI0025BE888D|nr:OmpA family protein [Brevundimonas sp.]
MSSMSRPGFMAVAGAAALALAGCEGSGVFRDRSELVAAPTTCTAKRFDIYFGEGQAQLTEPARQAIRLTADQLKDCDIRKVQVIGLASATGSSPANQTLSERRAIAVTAALEAEGWPLPAFEIAVVGDSGAVTADGRSEPLRRRTEVIVEAVPRR